MKIIVEKEMPLIAALALLAPDSSRSTLRSWLKQERVTIDDHITRNGSSVVVAGQAVMVSAKKQQLPHGLTLLYEGAGFVIVDKPAGLLSVATDKEKERTAYTILKKIFTPRKVHVVHRLDRETSGVMVFGLGEKSRDGLKKLFKSHDIERRYRAIVEGHVTQKRGTWRSYLYEDANYMMHTTQDKKRGQLAITHYAVVASYKEYTLLDITLKTGKKNQVRVHCQAAGYPIAGDEKYGAVSDPYNRLCLHAYTLAFRPPGGEKVKQYSSPIPFSDMAHA